VTLLSNNRTNDPYILIIPYIFIMSYLFVIPLSK
jgi:hypothetical protein